MTCSWSWAESWPQAQVPEGKSGIFQEPSCFCVQFLAQGQDTRAEPTTKEAKSKIQHLQPGHWTKQPDLELKIQVPK